MARPLRALVHRARRRRLKVYYDEAYRLPVAGLEASPAALELRRADDAVHYLLTEHAVSARAVVNPTPATYGELARAHTEAYLESLHHPEVLARIFAVDASEIVVDELMRSLRLAVGGTLQGARASLSSGEPVLNLMGGFHHAAPDRGAGFCALNDMAVAIKVLRADGFDGKVAVLDFDCHPPDGTAAFFATDPTVWLGSVSGAEWGQLDGVDEVLVPPKSTDAPYLEAVQRLLSRMPEVSLAFVLAGADVVAGDRLGTLAVSLNGVRQRDLVVAERLEGLPQVWLPAGGYGAHAWKVLAGVGLALALRSDERIPTDYDPIAARFSGIARSLRTESLGEVPVLTEADLAEALGAPSRGPKKLLGYYTAEGVEYALERYRVLPLLRRLGFGELHVVVDHPGGYDRARLLGKDTQSGAEVVLVELELERLRLHGMTFLFVNWLSLRNPRAKFSALRPQLPGQEVPGLGLAKEITQLLGRIAERLNLDGVAFRPSWFHMAFAARHTARFLDPARQGRFEALCRDLREVPLLEATRAVADGKVLLDGQPYAWEAEEMVGFRDPTAAPHDEKEIAAERERCRFTLVR